MSKKQSKARISKDSPSKRLASFNKTQEIYKLLEKGIIESEALLSSAVDRPQDDAHVLDLLDSTSNGAGASVKGSSKRNLPARKGKMKRSKR